MCGHNPFVAMDLPIKSIDELRAEGEQAAQSSCANPNPYPAGSDHHLHWECGHIAAQLERGASR